MNQTAAVRPAAAPRRIGNSVLPSSDGAILKPIETPFGILQVRPLPELDTHALFLTHERGTTMLVQHANGFSCHLVAKHMIGGDEAQVRAHVGYLLDCGGLARHIDQIIRSMRGAG